MRECLLVRHGMVADITGCDVTPPHLEGKKRIKGPSHVAPVKFACAVSVTKDSHSFTLPLSSTKEEAHHFSLHKHYYPRTQSCGTAISPFCKRQKLALTLGASLRSSQHRLPSPLPLNLDPTLSWDRMAYLHYREIVAGRGNRNYYPCL